MADATFALARVRSTHGNDLLPDQVILQQLDARIRWRERLLPPLVTVRLFLIQVLHGNVAITGLRHLAGFRFAASSYCQARLRLPLGLLQSLLQWTVDQAGMLGRGAIGPRVIIIDASTFSMGDTPSLRKTFGLPRGKRVVAGVVYPVAKFIGLIDLASGLFVDCLCGALYRHEMGLVTSLHRGLRPGDILLGDRAFCSFVHVALLNAAGIFGCFRLHQRRKVTAGCKRQSWTKPTSCPAWMDPAAFAALPELVEARIVTYRCARRGYRTKLIHIATTLPESDWSDEQIAELYGHRWKMETCFAALKTTMKSDVLKCQSARGIIREHLMYLLAYNLVRLAMLRYALREGVSVWRISFIDAMRHLASQLLGLDVVAKLLLVPRRPGREEPRVKRRRIKEYDLLMEPRASLKQRKKQAANA